MPCELLWLSVNRKILLGEEQSKNDIGCERRLQSLLGLVDLWLHIFLWEIDQDDMLSLCRPLRRVNMGPTSLLHSMLIGCIASIASNLTHIVWQCCLPPCQQWTCPISLCRLQTRSSIVYLGITNVTFRVTNGYIWEVNYAVDLFEWIVTSFRLFWTLVQKEINSSSSSKDNLGSQHCSKTDVPVSSSKLTTLVLFDCSSPNRIFRFTDSQRSSQGMSTINRWDKD